VAINVSLPDHLAQQLAVLAAAPEHHGSKSQVMETALRALIEGTASTLTAETFAHQVSTLGATLTAAIQDLHQSVQALGQLVQVLSTRTVALETRLTALEGRVTQFVEHQGRQYEELVRAYDGLKAERTAASGGWRGFRTAR